MLSPIKWHVFTVNRSGLNRSLAAELPSMSRVEVASAVARAWNRASLGYRIASGIHGYPDRIGRDIDVLVLSKDDALVAADLLKTELCRIESSFRTRTAKSPWGLIQVAVAWHQDGRLDGVPIDLMYSKVLWANGLAQTFLPQELFKRPTARVGPFLWSEQLAVAKTVIRPIVARSGAVNRFLLPGKREEAIAALSWPAALDVFAMLLGPKSARHWLEKWRDLLAIDMSDSEWLPRALDQARAFRYRVIVRSVARRPWRSVGVVARRALIELRLRLAKAPVIHLTSGDVNQTKIASESLKRAFVEVRTRCCTCKTNPGLRKSLRARPVSEFVLIAIVHTCGVPLQRRTAEQFIVDALDLMGYA